MWKIQIEISEHNCYYLKNEILLIKCKQNIMEGRKTFMGKIDVATKQYMSHKNVIADAFNF